MHTDSATAVQDWVEALPACGARLLTKRASQFTEGSAHRVSAPSKFRTAVALFSDFVSLLVNCL